ncbi:basic salivary proline-rich protein 2-like [Homarus americanus]|uniref:basic salivary proline-rich protein 2-like n=1 Tax=Homarus americanus TaxID=6706 RepID=UPI001C442129|nr:basic salivary proline-rich protein 2-like [Homarus americanus]
MGPTRCDGAPMSAPRGGGGPKGPPIGRGALECPPKSSWGPALGSLPLRDLPRCGSALTNPPNGGGALSGLPRNGRAPKGPTRGDPPGSSIACLSPRDLPGGSAHELPRAQAPSWPSQNGRVPKGPTRGDPPGSSIAWRPARCWCATNGPHRCGGALRGPPRAVGTPKDFPSSGGIPRCLLRGVSALKGPPRSGGASRKIPWGGVEQKRPPKGIGGHRGPLRGICYHSCPFRDDGIPGVLTSEMAPPWALPDTWFRLWTIIGAATSLGGPPKAGGAPRGPP